MGNTIIVLAVLLTLIFLISAVKADTSFFDNPDEFFIMSEGSETSAVVVGEVVSSGGGGSACLTNWNCSAWGNCINNIQIRNCAKEKSYCYADLKKKPNETQSCLINFIPEDEGNEIKKNRWTTLTSIAVIIIIIFLIFLLLKRISRFRS